jgi:integrase
MALPRGMFRRGGKLWARKDVPKPLQSIIGQTSLQTSLRTEDVREALPIFHGVMQTFESRIAAARKSLAETKSLPFVPITIPAEQLGLSPELAQAAWAAQQAKPENQIAKLKHDIQAKLEHAGMIASTPEPISMEQLFERWKEERKPSVLTSQEYDRSRLAFVKLNSDLPISEYTVVHARKWKDEVIGMRDRNGKALAHATRVKIFGAVSTLFGLADRNELLTMNPFTKIKLEKPKRAKAQQRQEWDTEELNKLFRSPVYSKGKRPSGGAGEAAYWLPVLALYHGFRAGELAQLDKADLIQRSGIWCLKIAPSYEDEGSKSTKTDDSVRIVPLHKKVINLGFLDYVRTVRGKKLWPKIAPDSVGRWAGNWSKWFGRYRKDIGLDERFKDFHSFRHGWKSAARGARIPEEHHDEITGHDNRSVGRSYGSVPIHILKEELDKITFDVRIPKWKSL